MLQENVLAAVFDQTSLDHKRTVLNTTDLLENVNPF